MRHFYLVSATLLLAFGASIPATAEVLQVPQAGPTTPTPAGMEIPPRGMHMNQVEMTYGKPESISPPVGRPPITRWDYPRYSVYFEYSYVIQSVVHR